MPDLLAQGTEFLASVLAQQCAGSVTLLRGAATATAQATRGQSQFEILGQDGSTRVVASSDWLIAAAVYDFGAGPVEPQRGDRVRITDGATTETYELLTAAGSPGWRWSDRHHRLLRLHTVRIG